MDTQGGYDRLFAIERRPVTDVITHFDDVDVVANYRLRRDIEPPGAFAHADVPDGIGMFVCELFDTLNELRTGDLTSSPR